MHDQVVAHIQAHVIISYHQEYVKKVSVATPSNDYGMTCSPPVLILHLAQLGVGGFHHRQGSTGVLHLLQWAPSTAWALAKQKGVAMCEQKCRAMQC